MNNHNCGKSTQNLPIAFGNRSSTSPDALLLSENGHLRMLKRLRPEGSPPKGPVEHTSADEKETSDLDTATALPTLTSAPRVVKEALAEEAKVVDTPADRPQKFVKTIDGATKVLTTPEPRSEDVANAVNLLAGGLPLNENSAPHPGNEFNKNGNGSHLTDPYQSRPPMSFPGMPNAGSFPRGPNMFAQGQYEARWNDLMKQHGFPTSGTGNLPLPPTHGGMQQPTDEKELLQQRQQNHLRIAAWQQQLWQQKQQLGGAPRDPHASPKSQQFISQQEANRMLLAHQQQQQQQQGTPQALDQQQQQPGQARPYPGHDWRSSMGVAGHYMLHPSAIPQNMAAGMRPSMAPYFPEGASSQNGMHMMPMVETRHHPDVLGTFLSLSNAKPASAVS
jgi:hypothetical protein